MKFLLLVTSLVFFFSCKVQKKQFSLLGKWKQTESLFSDRAKAFKVPIEDGMIMIFKNGNNVTDKFKKKGTYELKGERLFIKFSDRQYFYLFSLDGTNSKKMHLTPATPEYQIICDEGCADIYEKIDD